MSPIRTRSFGEIGIDLIDGTGRRRQLSEEDTESLGLLGVKKMDQKNWKRISPGFVLMLLSMPFKTNAEIWSL